MKDFIAGLNFPRAVILLSFVASAALAWFDFELGSELEVLRRAETEQAPQLVRNIQEHSIRLTQLQNQLRDDVWVGQNDPGLYARTVAQDNDVSLGQVDVTPSNDDRLGGGIVDKKYTIRPVNKDRGWSKENLGNFLYMLEKKSHQVRVTRVKITPPSRSRLKPHEVPPDEWTYEAEITSRQRE
jgi:hypothetical protein